MKSECSRTPPDGASGRVVPLDPSTSSTALPLPHTDFPPALQRTLRRMLDEEEAGDGTCDSEPDLTEPEFREALRKTAKPSAARQRRSDRA